MTTKASTKAADVVAAPVESASLPNTIEITAHAVAAEITELANGDLNETGDGLGSKFVRTAGGALYTYDISQPVGVGDFVVHLGAPTLGVRFFATRAAAVQLGIVAA